MRMKEWGNEGSNWKRKLKQKCKSKMKWMYAKVDSKMWVRKEEINKGIEGGGARHKGVQESEIAWNNWVKKTKFLHPFMKMWTQNFNVSLHVRCSQQTRNIFTLFFKFQWSKAAHILFLPQWSHVVKCIKEPNTTIHLQPLRMYPLFLEIHSSFSLISQLFTYNEIIWWKRTI